MNKMDWVSCKAKFKIQKIQWQNILLLLLNITLIFISFYFQDNFYYFPIKILTLTLALLQIYLLLHEATHYKIVNNNILSEVIAHVLGWLIFLPFLARKRSHLLHHSWTGHPIGDPANKRLIQRFSVINHRQRKILEFIWRSWLPLLALNDRIGLWRDAFLQRKNLNSSKEIKKEIFFIYLYIIFYILFFIFLIQQNLFLSFIKIYAPAFFFLLFLEELANGPHHAETPLLNETDRSLPYWEQQVVTHSCKSIPIWSNYILLNFNLHNAHHYIPWAPWYELKKIHNEMIKIDPNIEKNRVYNEITWSIKNRKKPLLNIMGHYFNKIKN
ncbi:fatty acid desaturase [Pigmentibacter sp. JX0631]|uniref:fatty acid desaturase n=1 Tax=Pigmentibacter sp. JX0631 TaxID=2976982 RepID=UPI0024692803|nr:fatty acid desaturase [Pigmentibacter sp. JX0631]WGL60135.1 fatty acid desaturase [Pigmentibacter sp. JX0631]